MGLETPHPPETPISAESPAWLERGTVEIFPHQPNSNDPNENLIARLGQARPLRIKFGIDPTGTEIHLGHSIVYRKLRAFQDAGHTAVLLIGDFTAQIGDPTGKSEVRRQLSPDDVRRNAETYIAQLRPILDFDSPGRLGDPLQLRMARQARSSRNSGAALDDDRGPNAGQRRLCRALQKRKRRFFCMSFSTR